MRGKSSSIKDTLKNLLKNYNLETSYADFEIKNNWHNLVQNQIALVTEPVKLENNCLTIRVKNEFWLAEIQTRKKELLEKLNKSLNAVKIIDLNVIK